jgi:hypothetical protein
MALRRQVVDLIRLRLLHNVNQARGAGHIPIVKHQPALFFMRILIEMADAIDIQRRTATLDAVDVISLIEKKLRGVRVVLAVSVIRARFQ